MIKLNGTAQNRGNPSVPDLHAAPSAENGGTTDKLPLSGTSPEASESVGDSHSEKTPSENENKSGTFSNKSSSYSRFVLKDGEPYLDAMPGVELDRDALISSAAEVIAQLDDPKKVDAFTRSVCRALKCATTDISRSANSKDDAVAAIAVAASSAPTFAKRSTLWKDDVRVEDEDGQEQKKKVNVSQEARFDEDDDVYTDQET